MREMDASIIFCALPERVWTTCHHGSGHPPSIAIRLGSFALLINRLGLWCVIDERTTLCAGTSRNGILGAARSGLRALGTHVRQHRTVISATTQ